MTRAKREAPEGVREAYEAGATLSELGRKHDAAHKTVKRWLIEQGVAIRTPRGAGNLTPEQERRALWLLGDGANLTSVARFLDMHPVTLEGWLVRRQR